MSEEEKIDQPIKKVKWFSDLVKNLPESKGESFTDRVIDLESAKVVRKASEVAMTSLDPKAPPPGKTGVEKGVTEGLEEAGKKIITDKLTTTSPIETKVMDALGDFVGDAVREKLGGGGKPSEAELELARRDRAEELNAMFQKFAEEVVGPIAEQVKALSEKKPGTTMSTDDAVEMVMGAQERAKKLLEKQGYSVESVNVTKEDVTRMLAEEERNYEDRLTKDKEQWEKESGAQVEIERERIQATEHILTGVMDRVFDIFLEPLKDKIHEAIEQGAFRGPGK